MEQTIHRSIWLDCAPLRAWQMFTDNNLLTTWLAEKADVEPRLGGKYEIFGDLGKVHDNCTAGCRVTACEPGQALSFTWQTPPRFGGQTPTLVTALFSRENGGTRLHLLHTGWQSEVKWTYADVFPDRAGGSYALRPTRRENRAQVWQAQAWAGALQRLAGCVNQPRPAFGRRGWSLAALVAGGAR